MTPANATQDGLIPLITDVRLADADGAFAHSMHHTGFGILRVPNGWYGLSHDLLTKARAEHEAFFSAPAKKQLESLSLRDTNRFDAGFFPLGSEGETGGPPNPVEILHHRKDRIGIDFVGFDFTATWQVYESTQKIVQEVLTPWLLKGLPANHPQYANMHRVAKHLDDKNRSVLRFLRYHINNPRFPPVPDETGQSQIINDRHQDACWMTLIALQTMSGLQLQDIEGKWTSIPLVTTSNRDLLLVVNGGEILSAASGGHFALCQSVKQPDGSTDKFGDPLFLNDSEESARMLQQWFTGNSLTDRKLRLVEEGFYPATPHRVVVPLGNKAAIRCSMPVFIHTQEGVPIQGPCCIEHKMEGYKRNKTAQRKRAIEMISYNYGVNSAYVERLIAR